MLAIELRGKSIQVTVYIVISAYIREAIVLLLLHTVQVLSEIFIECRKHVTFIPATYIQTFIMLTVYCELFRLPNIQINL